MRNLCAVRENLLDTSDKIARSFQPRRNLIGLELHEVSAIAFVGHRITPSRSTFL